MQLSIEVQPDVVLMDLRMGTVSGVEATRRIVAQRSNTAVLVLTMSDDDESILAAVSAGARGYLLKGVGEQEISAAIQSMARGDALFGSGISERLLQHVTGRQQTGRAFPNLTPREEQIRDLTASGHGNAAIAARLSVSPKTIRKRVSIILTNLGAEDRAGNAPAVKTSCPGPVIAA